MTKNNVNLSEIIKIRQSIRKYKDEEISDEDIDLILEAGRLSPSGRNYQPWRLKVLKKKDMRDELRLREVFPQEFVYQAPIIIVCTTDPSNYGEATKLDMNPATRAVRDMAIAAQSMVLQATALGLGTCYVGWLDQAKIKEVLKIDNNLLVPFVITLGVPDENPLQKEKKKMKEILL